jgi:hypothetical protein
LEEVLNDSDFPPSVDRLLFSAEADAGDHAGQFPVCLTWQSVESVVFNGHA